MVLPVHKQRRSRIEWAELLPTSEAMQQEAWERRATMLAYRRAGYSLAWIAEAFASSELRVRSLSDRAAADEAAKRLSPAEHFMAARDHGRATYVAMRTRLSAMGKKDTDRVMRRLKGLPPLPASEPQKRRTPKIWSYKHKFCQQWHIV